MSLNLRLASRLILANTTDPIDPEDRRRVAMACGHDEIEAWVHESSEASPDLYCLKFPGTGGRAERAGPHPCELVSRHFEVWAINPPGYGTSSGVACVSKMSSVCRSSWEAISRQAAGKPVVVTGNSLGCMYAMYVAAHFPVAGVMLRNPAPVHQLIQTRHAWWSLGLASRLIGSQVPDEMDTLTNARQCSAPAIFIVSAHDRVVPVALQQTVIDAYGGEAKKFVLDQADHHTPVPEQQRDDYVEFVETWGQSLIDL